ncbi:MAG: DUF3179 domain-containing protein [Actinomycetota bacterium]
MRRRARAASLLLLAAFGCSAAGSPAVSAPDLPGFSMRRLIDVAAPGDVPPVTHPAFESIAAAAAWLGPDAPVIAVRDGSTGRAYPLAILAQHEVVDDSIGAVPLAVTYSPIANAAIVFDRRARGLTLTFGLAGKVYQSDLVLYDRETKTLWLQIPGAAAVGQLKGRTLRVLPSAIAAFGEFVRTYPNGSVLARPGSGLYQYTPFPGYDSRAGPYEGFFQGRLDRRMAAMERVVGIGPSTSPRAYPYDALRATGSPAVVEDQGIVLFFGGSARSPLNTLRIAEGRVEGSSAVFDPFVDGRSLHFVVEAGTITDRETASTWSLLGRALSGPLQGRQLPEVAHVDAFWFVWAAFHPGTTVWQG